MGVGCAVLVFVCARLVNVGTGPAPKKGEVGFARFMAGIHVGMVLPLLYTGIFMWRASKAFGDAEKAYLVSLRCIMLSANGKLLRRLCFGLVWQVYLLSFLSLGSIGAFYAIYLLKPSKDKVPALVERPEETQPSKAKRKGKKSKKAE